MARALAILALLAIGAASLWLGAAPWRAETAAAAAPPAAGGAGGGGDGGDGAARAAAPEAFAPEDRPAAAMAPFLDRPLFSAARRPPPPETPGAPIAEAADPLLFGRYEIAGVVVLGDAAMALIRDVKAGALLRVRAGDMLGEAQVLAVDLETLTFLSKGVTFEAPVEAGE